MSGAVLALFGVAVAAAVVELLVPPAEGGTRRFLQFLTALAVLVLILRPFLSRLSETDGLLLGDVDRGDEAMRSEYERIFSEAVESRSAEQLRQGLKQLLEAEYGIEPQDCEVSVTPGEDGMPERILVVLSGKAILRDPDGIEDMLRDKFGCEAEVR
jgi:hypothetical protein